MAKQIKVKTVLSSGTAIATDSLASSLSGSVSVDNPIIQSAELTLVNTPAVAQDILPSGKTMSTYCYIKNMDSNNYISVRTKSASLEFARLKPGEHMWITVAPAIGLEVINEAAATSKSKVIYGVFDEKVA
jgi:hypothetical protein